MRDIRKMQSNIASAKLDALGNYKFTWSDSKVIEAIRNVSDIDCQLKARGQIPGFVEGSGRTSGSSRVLGSTSMPIKL
jgi:hypothetical protein